MYVWSCRLGEGKPPSNTCRAERTPSGLSPPPVPLSETGSNRCFLTGTLPGLWMSWVPPLCCHGAPAPTSTRHTWGGRVSAALPPIGHTPEGRARPDWALRGRWCPARLWHVSCW